MRGLTASWPVFSLLAHHSLAGVRDMDKESELTGSVDSIKFVNPHGSLTILVNKEDGYVRQMDVHLGSATRLAQRGIDRRGRMLFIKGTRSREVHSRAEWQSAGFLTSVKMPDGRVLNISSGNPND